MLSPLITVRPSCRSEANTTSPVNWIVCDETVTPPTFRDMDELLSLLLTERVILSTFCEMVLTLRERLLTLPDRLFTLPDSPVTVDVMESSLTSMLEDRPCILLSTCSRICSFDFLISDRDSA